MSEAATDDYYDNLTVESNEPVQLRCGGCGQLTRVLKAILALGGNPLAYGMMCQGCRARTAKWITKAIPRGSYVGVALCDACRGNRPADEDSRAPQLRIIDRFYGRTS